METGRDGTSVLQTLLARGQALYGGLRAWEGPGRARLQKLVRAELSFLNRLAALPHPAADSSPALCSTNFDHLEEVFRILQHPLVNGVSAVMQNLDVSGQETCAGIGSLALSSKQTAHVDVVCMLDGKPVWLIVSTRNPRYISWLDTGKHVNGLRTRLLLLLRAACSDPVKQPNSILLRFSGEVAEDVDRGLRNEFRAVHVPSFSHEQPSTTSREYSEINIHQEHLDAHRDCKFSDVEGWEWLDFEAKKSGVGCDLAWYSYEIGCTNLKPGTEDGDLGEREVEAADEEMERKEVCSRENGTRARSLSFPAPSDHAISVPTSVYSSSDQRPDLDQPSAADDQKLVNLDTTALVALVSEVSNGGADFLVTLPLRDMEKRFPSMHTFIREQALSELERPLVPEIENAMVCRQPIVSQYVYDEFLSIVSHVGGGNENDRARNLLRRLRLVPNTPSDRVMALPTSGRIKRRHKIVFGTGDFLNAPTLTANMAFVRAAREKGMPIAILEHRPRALTGD